MNNSVHKDGMANVSIKHNKNSVHSPCFAEV